jgi:hypothetical protein
MIRFLTTPTVKNMTTMTQCQRHLCSTILPGFGVIRQKLRLLLPLKNLPSDVASTFLIVVDAHADDHYQDVKTPQALVVPTT